MCGIAGAVGPHRPDEMGVSIALELMRRRGPDARGVHRDRIGYGHVTLLHTRLAIIDLDARSNQPFRRDHMTLVFNGEIYNYKSLRTRLMAMGHRFTTESDTEVIIEAYRRYAERCVDHFEGMWAFALFDDREQRCLLSRDPFGEKPLYWLRAGGNLYFASEVKALVALSGRRPRINENQVRRYLVHGYKSLYKRPETFFEEVHSLPPGSFAWVGEDGRIGPQRYWTLEHRPEPMDAQTALTETRSRLFTAIGLRLQAEVPVAFCLSGGVDSGVLASVAQKHFGHAVHAFSIVDEDPRYDEQENIDAVVRDLRCDHHVVRTSRACFFERLQGLVADHDGPVSTVTQFMTACLNEAISQAGFRVSLSGTAADELFTGYYDHYSFWLAEMHERPDFATLVADWQQSYGAFVRNPHLQDPMRFVYQPDFRDHIILHAERFKRFLVRPFDEPFVETRYTDSLLRNRMLNELHHEAVPVLLHEEDLNAMRVSVENRAPYLDRALASFLFTVPAEHLICRGYPKWLLRAAGEGLLVDHNRLDKRKRGFNVSIDSLVDRSDEATRARILDHSPIFEIVRRDAIEGVLDRDDMPNSYSKFLFSFLSAKAFLDHWAGLNP